MSTAYEHQSYQELHRLLKDAVEGLNGACQDRVHDPYQCYHWNAVGALTHTIEKLNECIEVVERQLGDSPMDGDHQAFLAQFDERLTQH